MTLSELAQKLNPIGKKIQINKKLEPIEVLDALYSIMTEYIQSPQYQDNDITRFITKKAIKYLTESSIFLDEKYNSIMFSNTGLAEPNNKIIKTIAEKYDPNNTGTFEYIGKKYIIKTDENKIGISLESKV